MTTNQSPKISDDAEMYVGVLANKPRIVVAFLDFWKKKHPKLYKKHQKLIDEQRAFYETGRRLEEGEDDLDAFIAQKIKEAREREAKTN